ncbi:MAG TPA: (d)CMP kinase, partial [Arachnia sp.]|nr:(d)CMP kinase [Arachnia sp.]
APVSPEDELLPELPAIAIDGPKGVGKTETLRRRAATTVTLDTIAQGELYRAYPERRELYAALAASCATR